MFALYYTLLMLHVCYAENFNLITVAVGENVTLSCKRNRLESNGYLFWIKLVPGNMPEVLGKTLTFDLDLFNSNSPISTKQEPDSFVLHIAKAKQSDMAFYFCLKSKRLDATFLNGTFLRIKGSEPDYPAIIQDSLSDTVHEGDSVNLQCSIFSEKKACPEESRVFWLRFSSVETRPSLIYAQKEVEGKCEHNPDTQTGQSCVFSFVKDNISLLDTGTYYCAVAACGRVFFGNGTKLEFEDFRILDLQRKNSLLLLCCVTLAFMVIVTAVLFSIKTKCCTFCKGCKSAERDASEVFGHQQTMQRNNDTLVYATAVFTQQKADRAGRIQARGREGTIYSDVRAFDKD